MARRILFAVLTFALAVAALPCRADLKPEEIAIIAARGDRESEALAKYYAKARSVPEDNICLVDMPKGEVCSRKDWTWAIRPEIRKWLDDNDPEGKLRCLATVWGVPLKIGPADKDAAMLRYKNFLAGERQSRMELLGQSLAGFDSLAADMGDSLEQADLAADAQQAVEIAKSAASKPPEAKADAGSDKAGQAADDSSSSAAGESADAGQSANAPKTDAAAKSTQPPAGGDLTRLAAPGAELEQLRQRLEVHLRSAQTRIGKMPVGPPRLQAQQRLQQLVAITGGVNVILQGLSMQIGQPNVDPALAANFQNLRGVQAAWLEARGLMEQSPPSIERDALIIAMLERIGGQLAALPWIEEQIANVDRNETGASFDSELSLVMWPDDYQLLRWQPNFLRGGYDRSRLRQAFPTLMVARIDAPTLKLAKGLIDTAIAVEKKGLDGKAYFDARGLAKLEDANIQAGSYADFDRALLITAKGINEQTNLGVTVNDKPELFQAGECPNAALYCGWYSLAKYVDAFDWVPGAVAYHLASGEAGTLHDPKTREWCKSMLEDGVCATIGPVYEPYLVSFPRPEEFFALLLQGKLSLVECYYRSMPFTSWMQVLIGDPLYRPFKNNPAIGGTVAPVGGSSPAAPPATEPAAETPPAGAQ